MVAGEGVFVTRRHSERGQRPHVTCRGLSELSHLGKLSGASGKDSPALSLPALVIRCHGLLRLGACQGRKRVFIQACKLRGLAIGYYSE